MSRYAIGTQYMSRGKAPKLYTVVDIHTTYNAAGAIVKTRYVATHEMCGQVVTESDVAETTIAMGVAAVDCRNPPVKS